MKCNMCNSTEIKEIHKGTRDKGDINVLKCANCGLVFLSSFSHVDENYYEESHMHDNEKENNFSEWCQLTQVEDKERACRLQDLCRGKIVIDFGCGNGGFLTNIKEIADRVIGIELEEEARNYLMNEQIFVYKRLEDYKGKADVITCFHVLEHLTEPERYINLMKDYLTEDGIIIIETPNSEDALLSFYESSEFADFTYWSPHIILYNYHTIDLLSQRVEMEVLWNKQIQRYPLSNHLYWLAKGMPGGHEKWSIFNTDILIKEYHRILEDNHMCDTLFVALKKKGVIGG